MGILTTEQRHNIAAAIAAAESATSGEFVAVVAQSSDDYYYIPSLWAAMLALLLPPLLTLLPIPAFDYVHYQLLLFMFSAVLFQWRPLKMLLVPREIKRRRAALLAREQFLLQGLHHTEGRNGILLFVSVAERYVELLADQAIDAAVARGTWDEVIARFVAEVKAGRIEQGLLQAIDACGRELARHFPVSSQDRNELANHLIEL